MEIKLKKIDNGWVAHYADYFTNINGEVFAATAAEAFAGVAKALGIST